MSENELGQASIPAVNQYLQLAKAQQLEVTAILADLEISQTLLADNNQHISGVKFQTLIAALIQLSEDELFGLHTANFVQPGSYSVLGYMSMNCATLGDAIAKIPAFERLVGDMGVTKLTQQDEYVSISWSCKFTDPLVKRHMVDNCLASWVTFARFLTTSKQNPVQVLLRRKQPTLQQCAQYQALFKCSVVFNQKKDAIIFDKTLLNFPLNQGNQQLLTMLESHAQQQLTLLHLDNNILEQVKLVIQQNFAIGKVKQGDIALVLGLGSKTLQRRLKTYHSSFKILLDEVRLKKAKDLLLNSSMNCSQISAQLAFNEPRSFYRWFLKNQQMTPIQFRKTCSTINSSTHH